MIKEALKTLEKVNEDSSYLNISIKNVDKVVKDEKSAADLINQEVEVFGKYDGCFTYDTLVETKEYGKIEIGKIVDENLTCSVKSMNLETWELEWKPVIGRQNKGKAENWVSIELENGEILEVTDNHWIYSNDRKEYVQVKDLKEGEDLIWKK